MKPFEELPEEYEEIPWSQLVPVQRDRSIQVVLIAIAAAAVILAVVFVSRRSGPGPPTMLPATVVAEPLVAEAEPATTVGVAVLPSPQIYSEADLMAALPPRSDLEAIARAEWFVTDFFTVDGDGRLAEEMAAILPGAVDLPQTDGTQVSYVEWARAVAVADLGDGRYDVEVWFRTLVGDDEGGFSRTGVRAVNVRLATDPEGRLAVADLPEPVVVSAPGIAPPWPAPATAPPALVAAAESAVTVFGEDPQLALAGRDDTGWRFVFSVGDASGLRFPMVIRSDG